MHSNSILLGCAYSPISYTTQLGEGEGFCKNFLRQKTCVGDGGERERALDDVLGIQVTVRSCCEKRIETKLCKSR